VHVRKNPHGITESFKVCLEFATTYNRAEAMHAAMHKNNTVKKGMRIMKNICSHQAPRLWPTHLVPHECLLPLAVHHASD